MAGITLGVVKLAIRPRKIFRRFRHGFSSQSVQDQERGCIDAHQSWQQMLLQKEAEMVILMVGMSGSWS
jgi:hypothetical protein